LTCNALVSEAVLKKMQCWRSKGIDVMGIERLKGFMSRLALGEDAILGVVSRQQT
jgi:hypothetical protein